MKKTLLIIFCVISIVNIKAQTIVTLGSGIDSTLSGESSPINIYFRSHHCQILYTKTELNAAGASGPGVISKLGFNILRTTTESLPNFSIKLKNTTSNDLSVYENLGLNTVFSSQTYSPTSGGFDLLTFGSNFLWDGTSNLLVDVCFDQVNTSTYSGQVKTYTYTGSTGSQYQFTRSDVSSQCGVTTNQTNSLSKPQLQLAFTAANACTGIPSAGNSVSSSYSICVNNPFSLDLNGNTSDAGLLYKWQSSTNGNTWTDLETPQTSWVLPISGINYTTYYQCIVTCPSSAQSSTSTPITVSIKPFIDCYCTPTYSLNCNNGDKFSDFSIANVVYQPSNCDFNGYSDSTKSVNTVINLTAGNTYSLQANIANGRFGGDMIAGAWIDYNANSIFEQSEFIYIGTGAAKIYSNQFTVPINALTNAVRMRLKLDANYATATTTLDPCYNNNYTTYGQILDYKVNITAAPQCSGKPMAGKAISTETAVCLNKGYTLNLTNNSLSSSINYQWQYSQNGTAWLNYGNVQNTIPISVSSQTVTTYYRCITTCTTTAPIADTSSTVVVLLNLPTACYCTPQNINCATASFTNVTFESVSDNPTCTPLTGYSLNTANTVTLSANQTYTISTTIIGAQFSAYAGAWIDYNQDGIFDDTEYNAIGNGLSGTYTGTITVPFTALAGNTRMRIKMESTWGSSVTLNPCSASYSDGQTLDYLIYMNPVSSCSGHPNSGNATASDSTICMNTPFTLNLINNDIASNIIYQWQKSPDNNTWTDLGSSQTTVPFIIKNQTSATYYRCLTTCTTSVGTNTSTSSVVNVTQNAATTCYCVPPAMFCSSDYIKSVLMTSLSNTSACGTNGYEDYTSTIPSTTLAVTQTYSMTVKLGNTYAEKVSVWIDYNQNGMFDSLEYHYLGTTGTSNIDSVSNTITIPNTALYGKTRMRVRNFSDFAKLLGPNDACISPASVAGKNTSVLGTGSGISYGETEDYFVTLTPPNCSTINFPPLIHLTGNTDICPGNTLTLDLSSPLPSATGITYQWKSYNGTSYVNVGSLSTSSNYTDTPTSNTSYFCEISCNGNVIKNTDTVFIKVHTITAAPTTTNVTCNGGNNGTIHLNASDSGGSALNYSWTPSQTPSADIATNLIAQNYTVVISNTINCSITQTISIIEPAAILITSPSKTDVSCFGLSDGSATVTVSGGTSPLTFSWMPSGGSALTANSLAANNYTFHIVDGNNCKADQFVTISQPTQLTSIVSNTIGSCLGGSIGQATIITSGGTGAYSYSWTSGGTNDIETNLSSGTYSCVITDANLCTNTQTVYIPQIAAAFSVSITGNSNKCEQLKDTLKSTITGSGAPFNYSWIELPSNLVSSNPNYTYTTSIGTYSYNLVVTDNNNCVVNSNTISVAVNPSSNISGTVTTNPTIPVSGRVVLFRYEPYYTKFDSVAGQNIGINGDYNFTSFTSGVYIVKAIPIANNLQIAYGDTAVNWKTAKQIIHGCAVNDVQNVLVKALTTFTPGTGSLSGKITEGNGYNHHHRVNSVFSPNAPGNPIGGIIVKGGRNPGGQMLVQTVTAADGTYTIQNLPDNTNDEYFILVDIPGLDTNHTYREIITPINNHYTNLDFIVDSVKINPVYAGVGIHDISAIANQIKVFPNPASNKVTIQYNLIANSTVKIELFDIVGKSVKFILPPTEQSINEHEYSVSLNDLTGGMYFMKLKISNIESVIKLIVIN